MAKTTVVMDPTSRIVHLQLLRLWISSVHLNMSEFLVSMRMKYVYSLKLFRFHVQMLQNSAYRTTNFAMGRITVLVVPTRVVDAVVTSVLLIELVANTNAIIHPKALCKLFPAFFGSTPVMFSCSCPFGEQLVNKTLCEPENECLGPLI